MNEYPPVSDSPPPAPVPQGVRVALPQSVPYVTYTIIGITSFVFVLQLLSIAIFGRFSGGIDLLEAYGAMIGSAVRAGELWRLITPVLLHDNIFFMHILFNMYALFSFGTGLERHFGHRRFLILYLLGGFSGNVI
jgi:rhomboid protease GluP